MHLFQVISLLAWAYWVTHHGLDSAEGLVRCFGYIFSLNLCLFVMFQPIQQTTELMKLFQILENNQNQYTLSLNVTAIL